MNPSFTTLLIALIIGTALLSHAYMKRLKDGFERQLRATISDLDKRYPDPERYLLMWPLKVHTGVFYIMMSFFGSFAIIYCLAYPMQSNDFVSAAAEMVLAFAIVFIITWYIQEGEAEVDFRAFVVSKGKITIFDFNHGIPAEERSVILGADTERAVDQGQAQLMEVEGNTVLQVEGGPGRKFKTVIRKDLVNRESFDLYFNNGPDEVRKYLDGRVQKRKVVRAQGRGVFFSFSREFPEVPIEMAFDRSLDWLVYERTRNRNGVRPDFIQADHGKVTLRGWNRDAKKKVRITFEKGPNGSLVSVTWTPNIIYFDEFASYYDHFAVSFSALSKEVYDYIESGNAKPREEPPPERVMQLAEIMRRDGIRNVLIGSLLVILPLMALYYLVEMTGGMPGLGGEIIGLLISLPIIFGIFIIPKGLYTLFWARKNRKNASNKLRRE
jgi:hypothetical protein